MPLVLLRQPLAAVAFAALLVFCGLTRHAFWDDEAYTALFARNLLHTGTLTAWDGHALIVFRGGETLDSRLHQNEVSPLQFWLVAPFMAVLGQTTLAGRLPFVLTGLLALLAVYYWSRELATGTDLPPWLPTWLLALNVPFLLYIGQCRYYALVLLLAPTVFLAAVAAARGGSRLWFAAGAAAAAALALSNYIAAAATAAALAMAVLAPPLRNRCGFAFAAIVLAVVAALLGYVLLQPGVYAAWQARQGSMGRMAHASVLFGRELRDLGPFQFFPLLPVPFLAVPFRVARLHTLRPLAARAIAVLAALFVALAMTAAASPQDPGGTHYADMRYALEVMALGVFPTATAIFVVSRWAGRAAGALLTMLIVFSNIPYVGSWPPRCTLCDRIAELRGRHPSGTDALLTAARALPAGTTTMVVPDYMTLPLMFYRPDLRFPNLLDPARNIDADVRARLPPWVFAASTSPDAVLRGIMQWPPAPGMRAGAVHLSRTAIEEHFWVDQTRPELPWHSFHYDPADDRQFGWALYQRDSLP